METAKHFNKLNANLAYASKQEEINTPMIILHKGYLFKKNLKREQYGLYECSTNVSTITNKIIYSVQNDDADHNVAWGQIESYLIEHNPPENINFKSQQKLPNIRLDFIRLPKDNRTRGHFRIKCSTSTGK
jgi:hypothetical protein